MSDMKSFIYNMPKAELHLHLEGTIQPSMLLEMAQRNGVDLPYKTEAEVAAAQDYPPPPLVSFLRHHYERVSVLLTGRDLYDITLALLKRCQTENMRHVELMFDPQVHLEQGLSFEEMMEGLYGGLEEGTRTTNVSSFLIMCANRERSQEGALRMLDFAADYRKYIIGVGLDSYEQDNPPEKFIDFFHRARKEGYRLTAHCDVDQENSPEHIRQCIHLLGVERIDHGTNCLDDPELIKDILDRNICLTVCPTRRLSDPGPRRTKRLREMFNHGLLVTINTDDPEEFASRYLSNLMTEVQSATGYTKKEMIQYSQNSFIGSWLDEHRKNEFLEELDTYAQIHGVD